MRHLPYVAACSLLGQAMALYCRASACPSAFDFNTGDIGAASQGSEGPAGGTAPAFRGGPRGWSRIWAYRQPFAVLCGNERSKKHKLRKVYSKPSNRAPQTYGQLQEHIFAQRAVRALDVQAQRRVETADDLATILQEFASDGTVLKALRDFAMPPHRRQKAASVMPRATQAAEKLKIKDDSNAFPWTIHLASPAAAHIAKVVSSSCSKTA